MKRKRFVISYFLCSALFIYLSALPLNAYSTDDNQKSLETAQRLANHLNNLTSLRFHFTQRTMGQISGRARQASGMAFLAKIDNKALMRWNYQTPDRQIIISDGETLRMYFEKLNQMIITPAENLEQDLTYSFFTGKGEIEKDFLVSDGLTDDTITEETAGFEVIKLIPRAPTTQLKAIRLWITNGAQIKRIEIRDNFDTITLLNISDIEENSLTSGAKPFDPTFFEFTPPEGTEILHQ